MSFDGLAPHYRRMERLLAGNKLQRCRTTFLGRDPALEQILIVGEGNGRFLLECRRRFTTARITCVDDSWCMLKLAQERLVRHHLSLEGVEFVQADALSWNSPQGVFDAVITHFFLDCFATDQLQRLVASLARAAKPNAVWLLADFQIPAAGLPRYRAKVIHKAMYLFFRVTCRLSARALSRPDDFLQEQHFTLQERQISEWGLLHSDRWVRRQKGGRRAKS